MSAEHKIQIYLRCDEPADWSNDGRCTVSHGYGDHWPENGDALEALAREARTKGWQVDLLHEGLKGWSAKSLCPDHAPSHNGGSE